MGLKIVVSGRIQTGSYTNREGIKVYTTEVIVDDQEFAESKNADTSSSYVPQYNQNKPSSKPAPAPDVDDGFMNIPDGIDEELPFH